MIEMALWFLQSLGVEARLLLNSVGCRNCRPRYVELLQAELSKSVGALCEDCRRRAATNTLRVFDCKVESCQPHIEKAARHHGSPVCGMLGALRQSEGVS